MSHNSQRRCFGIKQEEIYATHHVESISHFATSFFEMLSLFFFPPYYANNPLAREYENIYTPNIHSPFRTQTNAILEPIHYIAPVHSNGSAMWLTTQNIQLESNECYTVTPYWDVHRLSPVR